MKLSMNVIDSPIAKAIIAGIGAMATFLESALTPHTTPWLIVGVVLAGLTMFGTYLQPNADEEPKES